jgi:Membrane-fusion protein
MYRETGQLHFVDNTVNTGTDTVIVRGTIPNPKLAMATKNSPIRDLYDNEFVTVYLEGVKPVTVLGIPRSAVLMDQQGDYVWVVGQDDKVERRTVTLGQSTPTVAAVTSGLKAGEIVVSEGVQKVRGGQKVSPSPAEPAPGATK